MESELDRMEERLSTAEGERTTFEDQIPYFEKARREFIAQIDESLEDVNKDQFDRRSLIRMVRKALSDDPVVKQWLSGSMIQPDGLEHLKSEVGKEFPEINLDNLGNCFWLADIEWSRCYWIENSSELLVKRGLYRYTRISHLRSNLSDPIHKLLGEVNKNFESWAKGESKVTIWRINGEKTEEDILSEFVEYTDYVHRLVIHHYQELLDQSNEMKEKIKLLGSEIDSKSKKLKSTREKIKEILDLEKIETPFGTLPINIEDLIILLPLLLAISYLQCVLLLEDTSKIRKEYKHFRTPIDDGDLDNRYISMIAPLWIDPFHNSRQRQLRALLICLPSCIYLLCIWWLYVNKMFEGVSDDQFRLSVVVYSFMYLVGAIFAIWSVCVILKVEGTWSSIFKQKSTN